MKHSIPLAVKVGLQDLGKVSSSFLLRQYYLLLQYVEHVLTYFRSLHHVNIVLLRCEHFIYLDHVTMFGFVLEVSFCWNSFAVYLKWSGRQPLNRWRHQINKSVISFAILLTTLISRTDSFETNLRAT